VLTLPCDLVRGHQNSICKPDVGPVSYTHPFSVCARARVNSYHVNVRFPTGVPNNKKVSLVFTGKFAEWFLVTVTEWYCTKRPMQLRPFPDRLCPPPPPHLTMSSNHSRLSHHRSVLWLQRIHLVAKWGETRREVAAEFCLSVSLSYFEGSLTFR
jgi:hypothetical protein